MGLFDGLIGSALGFLGGNSDRNAQKDMNYENAAQQREFAQNGVQWRVEDAKRAGISPLAAMGAQLYNASPSFMSGGSSRGADLHDMGQNVGRAVQATMSRSQRVKAEAMDAALLRKAEAEASIAEGQATRINQPTNPPMPTDPLLSVLDGQGDTWNMPSDALLPPPATVSESPMQRTMSDRNNPAKEAGVVNSYQFSRNGDGSIGVLPSSDTKARIEDMGVLPLMWHLKMANKKPPEPPRSELPGPDYRWGWNPLTLTYSPVKKSTPFSKSYFNGMIKVKRKGGY